MGMISSTNVVTRAEYHGNPKLFQAGNREWVTAIESIRASGEALPPYITFKAKGYIEGWLDSSLPISSRIEVSQNGWATDKIGSRAMALNPIYCYDKSSIARCMASFNSRWTWKPSDPTIRSDLGAK